MPCVASTSERVANVLPVMRSPAWTIPAANATAAASAARTQRCMRLPSVCARAYNGASRPEAEPTPFAGGIYLVLRCRVMLEPIGIVLHAFGGEGIRLVV